MSMVVPTLDSSGWVSGLAQKVDRLLSYWLISQYSQTDLFIGKIRSLTWLLQRHGTKDVPGLQDAVTDSLNLLFDAYFDEVIVDVSINPYEINDSMLDIKISITVIDAGVSYSAGALLNTTGVLLNKITTLTPGGPTIVNRLT